MTSADYSANSVIGGNGGIAAEADSVIKNGFAGQLYEVASINLSATPETVNEGDTRQISANILLDDDSILVLQNTDNAWNINGWPLAFINQDGMVTADYVYETATGTVYAAYNTCTGHLSLAVLDIEPDNYGSYAYDGLADKWQVAHFGINNPSAAPQEDPDFDGQDNRYDGLVGTEPTNSTSRFAMQISNVNTNDSQMDILFNPTFTDRNYIVYKTEDITSDTWTNMTAFTESTNGTDRTVRDLNATNNSSFYRVQVILN